MKSLIGLAGVCFVANGSLSLAQTRPTAEFPNWALGRSDARVTMLEYASLTCGACAAFHSQIMPTTKQRYIDTGRVKYVLRPLPTPPFDLAVGMHALTLCAGPSRYYPLIDAFFERQAQVFAAAGGETGPKGAIFAIAEDHGGLNYAASEACLRDPVRQIQVRAGAEAGRAVGVVGTPTVFINGVRITLPAGQNQLTLSDVTNALDAALRATAQAPTSNSRRKKR